MTATKHKKKKVTLCHRSGPDEVGVVIRVSSEAWWAHIEHGDTYAPHGAIAGDECRFHQDQDINIYSRGE